MGVEPPLIAHAIGTPTCTPSNVISPYVQASGGCDSDCATMRRLSSSVSVLAPTPALSESMSSYDRESSCFVEEEEEEEEEAVVVVRHRRVGRVVVVVCQPPPVLVLRIITLLIPGRASDVQCVASGRMVDGVRVCSCSLLL